MLIFRWFSFHGFLLPLIPSFFSLLVFFLSFGFYLTAFFSRVRPCFRDGMALAGFLSIPCVAINDLSAITAGRRKEQIFFFAPGL